MGLSQFCALTSRQAGAHGDDSPCVSSEQGVAGSDSASSASPTEIGLKGDHRGFLEHLPSLIRSPGKSTIRRSS
jgi:hypothetical protein